MLLTPHVDHLLEVASDMGLGKNHVCKQSMGTEMNEKYQADRNVETGKSSSDSRGNKSKVKKNISNIAFIAMIADVLIAATKFILAYREGNTQQAVVSSIVGIVVLYVLLLIIYFLTKSDSELISRAKKTLPNPDSFPS